MIEIKQFNLCREGKFYANLWHHQALDSYRGTWPFLKFDRAT